MASISKVAGENGCDLQVGAGTFTPSGRHTGKKIWAIGIHATAEITNFKHTPTLPNGRPGSQVTVTGDGWIGISLGATAVSSLIPLGEDADEVVVASGSVVMFFR